MTTFDFRKISYDNIQHTLQLMWFKKLIQDTIFDAELMKARSTVDEKIILANYATELNNPFVKQELQKVIRRLRNNQEKHIAYRQYFPNDVVTLFNTPKADIGRIVKVYAPIRRIVDKNYQAIKSALLIPLIIYVFIISILGGVVSELKQTRAITLDGLAGFLMDHFMLINIVVLIGVVSAFFIFPKKLPLISTAFKKLDGLLALSLVETLMGINVAMPTIIEAVKNQFGIVSKRVDGDIAELADILQKAGFINQKDKADIKLSAAYTNKNEIIALKKEDRLEESKRFSEMVGEIVKHFSIVIMSIPIIQFVVILTQMTQKASEKLG